MIKSLKFQLKQAQLSKNQDFQSSKDEYSLTIQTFLSKTNEQMEEIQSLKLELAKNIETQKSLEKKLGDSLRKNEKFSSYKTPIGGENSQRSKSVLNDS